MNVIAATKGWDVVAEAASRCCEPKSAKPKTIRATFSGGASVVMLTWSRGAEGLNFDPFLAPVMYTRFRSLAASKKILKTGKGEWARETGSRLWSKVLSAKHGRVLCAATFNMCSSKKRFTCSAAKYANLPHAYGVHMVTRPSTLDPQPADTHTLMGPLASLLRWLAAPKNTETKSPADPSTSMAQWQEE
jgi:hypothetical protein